MIATKPKTMLDRNSFDVSNDNYLFISYSHRNIDNVFSVLNELYDENINYWYDDRLLIGDKWDEIVNQKLINSHCVGVICFISEDYFASEACALECKEIQDICKSRNFIVLPILLQHQKTSDNYYALKEKNINLYISMELIQDLFPDNKLYSTSNEDSIKKLVETICEKTERVINNKDGLIKNLLERKKIQRIQNSFICKFGMFYQDNPIVLHRQAINRIILNEYDERYFGAKKDAKFYPFENIMWRLLDVNEEEVLFIAHKCMFISSGSVQEIKRNIKSFYDLSFDEEEKKYIEIDVLDDETVKKYNGQLSKDYFASSEYILNNCVDCKDIIWVVNNDKAMLFNAHLNCKIEPACDITNMYACVLPIIKVKLKYIK